MTHSSNKKQEVLDFLASMAEKKRLEIAHIQTTIKLIEANKSDGSMNLDNPILASLHATTKKIAVKERKILLPVKEFVPFGKLDMKIAHVLSVMGSGFREDILREIILRQPELKARKLEPLLAVRLSYLIKNGLIAGEKFDRRYRYALLSADAL